jgi:hypothetical protein
MYFHFFFQYEVITMAWRPTPREGAAVEHSPGGRSFIA